MDVQAKLQECSLRQQGLATTKDLDAVGVTRSTLSRARTDGDVTRVHRGVYSRSALPEWPVTTVLDCVRQMKLQEAVVLCDSALRSRQVTLRQLVEAARRLRGVRHATRVRRALALCDPECGSVLESALRVEMIEAGISGFVSQRVVRDVRGRYILRVDFCFETAQLIVEADGARWHPDPARDRRLDNRLVAAGWRVLRFTWSEVLHDPAAVLELIRSALLAGSNDVHLPREPTLAAA